MPNRRHLLKATAAAAALPSPVLAQVELTVEEVLFDPQIPVLGKPDGDVTIAEYFYYQCPFCKRGHQDLIDVVRGDGNVRLVMKDWPISASRPFTPPASCSLRATTTRRRFMH